MERGKRESERGRGREGEIERGKRESERGKGESEKRENLGMKESDGEIEEGK